MVGDSAGIRISIGMICSVVRRIGRYR
jgi:hypothetical protein